jgi:large subunit ribosomal protein L20
MARIKGAVTTRRRRRKVLKLAKGYWGGKSRLFKTANQAVMKSLSYSYISRRLKKRDFRRLWITRISAAVKPYGINYSRFMHGLKKLEIPLNRKVLSEMAIHDKKAFASIVEKVKTAI